MNTSGHPNPPPFCQATSFVVTTGGPSPQAAAQLARVLGLPVVPLAEDGALRWMDTQRFQRVPTQAAAPDPGSPLDEGDMPASSEAIDLDALSRIRVLPDDEAVARATAALRRAGLLPVGASPVVGHSMFEIVPADDDDLIALRMPLDTHVGFDVTLGGLPLIGPGAKLKMVFDGDGKTTQLLYAMRGVRPGPVVPAMAPQQGDAICAARLFPQGRDQLRDDHGDGPPIHVSSQMVYYAPPLEMRSVRTILPHFLCTASVPQPQAPDLLLRRVLVPAVADAPRAEVTAQASYAQDGVLVMAHAAVAGGTPPYTYEWSARHTTLDPAAAGEGPHVSFFVSPREETDFEQVSVVVTDANGLTGSASALVLPDNSDAFAKATERTRAIARESVFRVDVGTEWIGLSQGLGGSAGNAGGWVSINAAEGIPVEFNWGDFNAFERDFKDPSKGGDDSNWVDNVDMVFYTGHANGFGWTFPGNVHDGALQYPEAVYGNRDLEWLVIAACGPLQASEGGLSEVQRWGPAFDGLHMMLAYANVSNDNSVEGQKLARYMHGLRLRVLFTDVQISEPIRIRQAWAQTATEVQPSSVTYAMMGPVASNGSWNFNDYFWGRGPTTFDIPRSITTAYWIIRAPC